jgi:hypothetical protein
MTIEIQLWTVIKLVAFLVALNYAVRFIWTNWIVPRQKAAELNYYRRLATPVVVFSPNPFYTGVSNDAEEVRQLIQASGNKLLDPETDVIEYPYKGAFRTLDGIVKSGYRKDWGQYIQEVAELQAQATEAFQLKIANAENGGIRTANETTAYQSPWTHIKGTPASDN